MARALEQAGQLQRLVTRWTFSPGELRWARALGLPGGWARRPLIPVDRRHLRRLPLADLRDRLNRWRGADSTSSLDGSFAMVDRSAAKLVDAHTAAVLAREDACLESFGHAARVGRLCLYVLPTACASTVKQLVDFERGQFPEAFCAARLHADFAPERLTRKQAELDAATQVLCPSTFVRRSAEAAGVSAERLTTLPLGADTSWTPPTKPWREPVFLYVGNISARKGAHRLIRAWKTLGAHRTHRLRFIGELGLPGRFVAEYKSYFEYVPPKPREQLPAEYSRAQAFVFNAMADGFGHVFAEAMVCGTPVLASRNCGAPDLVSDGVEGKLFDYGNDDQLTAALDWALSHPAELEEMGAAARQSALRWGWREFQAEFMGWIETVLRER